MKRSCMLVLIFAAAIGRAGEAAVATNVSVDFGAKGRAVSPLIFGVSFGDPVQNKLVGYTLDRWGGNSTTRYNWQANFYNTANDYYFENIANCNAAYCPPGLPKSDLFIASVLDAGAQPLMAIPTIGWMARADSPINHPFYTGFSTVKYGAQTSTDPFDVHAGNGECNVAGGFCDGSQIVGNNPADTSVANLPADAIAWIAHLQSTFGAADGGGVKFYSLDNEIMLWNSTHRDVHPLPLTFAGAWTETHDYATAIKQQEPDALVTGPVTWGYCDLFGSAADNCVLGSDRSAHGDLAFVAWYLQQVCANPLPGGKHLVDYLDLHYYPQGANVSQSNSDDATTAGRRLRSLKELYDPTWASESWIADLGDADSNHYSKPNLIPRARAWIDQYCPGTKLAITEYNWGGDDTNSGAVAQAELLAIFAREGVDLGARWVAPAANSKTENAYKLFLDYDAAGGNVAGNSVAATSANIDQIGAYGFRLVGQRNMVLLTNKDTSATHSVALTFAQPQSGAWKLYGFDSAQGLHLVTSNTFSSPATALTLDNLPALSASLLVLPDNDVVFADGFE